LGGGEKGVAFAVLLAGGGDWKTRWAAEFLTTPSQRVQRSTALAGGKPRQLVPLPFLFITTSLFVHFCTHPFFPSVFSLGA